MAVVRKPGHEESPRQFLRLIIHREFSAAQKTNSQKWQTSGVGDCFDLLPRAKPLNEAMKGIKDNLAAVRKGSFDRGGLSQAK